MNNEVGLPTSCGQSRNQWALAPLQNTVNVEGAAK